MEVGPLTAADRPRWTELWREYLLFYDTTLPDAVYEHTWARLMQGGPVQALAARRNGEVIGITHFLFHASCWTLTDVCYLQDLFVHASARGTGAGRALIEAVAAAARARKAARLYWLTQDHNATARRLYDRIARHSGFIRYEYPPLG